MVQIHLKQGGWLDVLTDVVVVVYGKYSGIDKILGQTLLVFNSGSPSLFAGCCQIILAYWQLMLV